MSLALFLDLPKCCQCIHFKPGFIWSFCKKYKMDTLKARESEKFCDLHARSFETKSPKKHQAPT